MRPRWDGGNWTAAALLVAAGLCAVVTGPGDFGGTVIWYIGWLIVLFLPVSLLGAIATALADEWKLHREYRRRLQLRPDR